MTDFKVRNASNTNVLKMQERARTLQGKILGFCEHYKDPVKVMMATELVRYMMKAMASIERTDYMTNKTQLFKEAQSHFACAQMVVRIMNDRSWVSNKLTADIDAELTEINGMIGDYLREINKK